jgi:hypothetical protein
MRRDLKLSEKKNWMLFPTPSTLSTVMLLACMQRDSVI